MSDLTAKEQDNVRAALRFIRAQAGTWLTVAKGLGIPDASLRVVMRGGTVTPRVAFRTARVAKVGVDDVLTGQYPPAGVCPYCGHRSEPTESPRDGR